MVNEELAKIFSAIAQYLDSEEVAFKPYAYRRVASSLEALEREAREIYESEGIEGLKEISGVGESIALQIEQYLKTGKIKQYEELKKKLPIDLAELTKIEGLGPRKARILYRALGVRNIKDLEKKAKGGKIRKLPGFGEKAEKNILQGIAFTKKDQGRFSLNEVLPFANQIKEKLSRIKSVSRVEFAGSLRRMKETVGDVDFLVISSNPQKVMDFFTTLPEIVKVWGKGATKASVRLSQGFDMDLRVVSLKSYAAALIYFTGSKEHNIRIRKIAMDKGYKLNEYGLFKGSGMIPTESEEEIYQKLGMQTPPPEIREDEGEVERALAHSLPVLVQQNDIKGDLHLQTNWNGGRDSIEQMAEFGRKLGYQYIGISDHTKFLRIERGLDEKQLLKQHDYITQLNRKKKYIHILHGCEANIMTDGSIDIKDEVLAKLDYVIAGVHSQMKMPKTQMTERIARAVRNPHVDIISHPTGRILKRREEYQVNLDTILRTARESGTILEINSFPERLDLNDRNIMKAKEAGVKLIVNTDAHLREHMNLMRFGVAMARRGWAIPKDIINTNSLEKLLEYFK